MEKTGSPPARFGKSIYITQKHHERISKIVSIIGNRDITLYDYLDNVLTEHFNRWHDEIVSSIDNRKLF
jgi:hypothetical protein